MVENAFENDCIIDCKELKKMQFRQNKLVRDRQKCKTHLKAAQNTLDEIEKDVGAKLLLYAGAALTTLCVGGGKNKTVTSHCSINSRSKRFCFLLFDRPEIGTRAKCMSTTLQPYSDVVQDDGP